MFKEIKQKAKRIFDTISIRNPFGFLSITKDYTNILAHHSWLWVIGFQFLMVTFGDIEGN